MWSWIFLVNVLGLSVLPPREIGELKFGLFGGTTFLFVLVRKYWVRTTRVVWISKLLWLLCRFPHVFNVAFNVLILNLIHRDDLLQVKTRILFCFCFFMYIISKMIKRITNNHSLSQLQQLTQATDIQEEELSMSINIP